MLRETDHGSIKFICNGDSDALGKLVAATFGTQEDHSTYLKNESLKNFKHEEKSPGIHTSNSRMDNYLFYFSSKL